MKPGILTALHFLNLALYAGCVIMLCKNVMLYRENRRRERLYQELRVLCDVVAEKIHNLDNIAEPGEDYEIMPLGELQVKSVRLSAELREIEEIQDYISRRMREL